MSIKITKLRHSQNDFQRRMKEEEEEEVEEEEEEEGWRGFRGGLVHKLSRIEQRTNWTGYANGLGWFVLQKMQKNNVDDDVEGISDEFYNFFRNLMLQVAKVRNQVFF